MKANDGNLGPQKPRKRPGRVPVSCAECRRLKMRCDRNHPCENCTKRGCAAICPDGTLTTGKHNRMILSNTEELHDKIESLLERIQLLEDALRALQSSVSTQPHPLLANQSINPLLSVPVARAQNDNRALQRRSSEEEDEGTLLDSFGTLSIGSDGETNYLGQTARADYLLNDSDSDDNFEFGRLPREFYDHTWPEPPPPDNSVEETVLSFLPELKEAYSLCEVYLSYANWLGPFVPREVIYEDFIAHVYHLPNRPWADTVFTCPHRLSVLFAIFSLGALFDPARSPYNPEADDYYHLARVALSFKSPVLETTVHAVLAILHIVLYLDHCDSPQGHEQGWVMLGVATKLALSMGLHRDSSHWKLDENISQHRHSTFWQLYIMETIASLRFGRPPLLSEAFVDCPLPKDSTSQLDEGHRSYHSWMIQFMRLVRHILQEAFGAKTPSYSTVLALDRQVREFGNPEWPGPQYGLDSQHPSPLAKLQRWCVLQFRETILLHLHRSFLAEALSDKQQDPLRSKYSQSVKSCFESARRLIEGLAWINDECPDTALKIGGWFAASVSSATVMCLLVTRCPASEFTRPSMEKLESVYSVIQKVSTTNRTARRNLEATRRLRNMARAALDKARLWVPGSALPLSPASLSLPAEDSTALDRCCGKTQVRARQTRTPGPGPKSRAHRDAAGARSAQRSFSLDRRVDGEWDTRAFSLSTTTSDLAGPSSSCADDFSRPYGFASDALYPPGLDSTWHNFIQQLGF